MRLTPENRRRIGAGLAEINRLIQEAIELLSSAPDIFSIFPRIREAREKLDEAVRLKHDLLELFPGYEIAPGIAVEFIHLYDWFWMLESLYELIRKRVTAKLSGEEVRLEEFEEFLEEITWLIEALERELLQGQWHDAQAKRAAEAYIQELRRLQKLLRLIVWLESGGGWFRQWLRIILMPWILRTYMERLLWRIRTRWVRFTVQMGDRRTFDYHFFFHFLMVVDQFLDDARLDRLNRRQKVRILWIAKERKNRIEKALENMAVSEEREGE